MVRRQFLSPPNIPPENTQRCLVIPNSKEWLGIFNSALLDLAQPWQYEQVHETDLAPETVASICYQIYVDWLAGDCGGVPVDCPVQPQWQVDPVSGLLQWSYDDGATWSDVTYSEISESPSPSAPLPPVLDGTNDQKRCQAAWNAARVLDEYWKQVFGAVAVGIHNTLLSINEFLHDLNMALFQLVYSPYQGYLEATGFFDFQFGVYMTAPNLTVNQVRDLACLLYLNATVNVDDRVAFDYQAITDNVIDVMGINPGTALKLLIDYIKQPGLDYAGGVGTGAAGDCSLCEGFYHTWFNGSGLQNWTLNPWEYGGNPACTCSHDAVEDRIVGCDQGFYPGYYRRGAWISQNFDARTITRMTASWGHTGNVTGTYYKFYCYLYSGGVQVWSYINNTRLATVDVAVPDILADRVDVYVRDARTTSSGWYVHLNALGLGGDGTDPF